MQYTLQSIQQYLFLLRVAADKLVTSAHWAYFLTEYQAKNCRLEAQRRGYTVLLSDRSAAGNQFVVIFTAAGLLTPQCFLDQVLKAQQLVEEYGGEYDGYEHSAIKTDDGAFIPVDYQTEPGWAVRV